MSEGLTVRFLSKKFFDLYGPHTRDPDHQPFHDRAFRAFTDFVYFGLRPAFSSGTAFLYELPT